MNLFKSSLILNKLFWYLSATAFLIILLFLISCGIPTDVKPSQLTENLTAVTETDTVQKTVADNSTETENREPEFEKWILSADQQNLIDRLGYPDEFVIYYDDYDNGARSETWSYSFLQTSFFFYNGAYGGSQKVFSENASNLPVSNVTPEDFTYRLDPLDVNYVMGAPGDEIVDKNNHWRYLIFNNATTICIFNSKDNLVSVLSQLNPTYEKDK